MESKTLRHRAIQLTHDEVREALPTRFEIAPRFGFGHSFVIRHLAFVIGTTFILTLAFEDEDEDEED